jgi:hypothetical protein
MTKFSSQLLYKTARALKSVGMLEQAASACKLAVKRGNHEKARRLLSRLELPGEDYFALLARIHAHLKPRTYVEIGVAKGFSIRLASPHTAALGVDPHPKLEVPTGPNVRIFAETSDDFFASHDVIAELSGKRVELSLIDGMHQFEYALRDFINLERLSGPGSVVLIHDCYPIDELSAARDRRTEFWSGDVWRLIPILKKHRPDLAVHTIATRPSGLGVVMNLQPSSTVLMQNLSSIIAEGHDMSFSILTGRKSETLNAFPNDWPKIRKLLDTVRH